MQKRALCVGINDYPGTGSDLHGCVNDARAWAKVLGDRGYQTKLLLDKAATKKAIVDALRDLIAAGVAKGDSLVFTYSGHGSYITDTSGDEADQRDEALCPFDIDKGQLLLDDELATIFGRKKDGVRLFFVSDSCHSGTVARFAPAGPEASQAGLVRVRFLPPETFVRGAKRRAALARVSLKASTRQKYPALLFAACRDFEYSYDARIGGKPTGAFTYYALEALAKNPATPTAWMTAIRKRLPSQQYPQSPQLYGASATKKGKMF